MVIKGESQGSVNRVGPKVGSQDWVPRLDHKVGIISEFLRILARGMHMVTTGILAFTAILLISVRLLSDLDPSVLLSFTNKHQSP